MRSDRVLLAVVLVFVVFGWAILDTEFLVPDSAGYLAYIRSLVFDHDIHFGNEFRALGVQRAWNHLSETGYTINMFAIGSSILWAPFFALGHVVAYLQRAAGADVPLDGLSKPYLQALHLGSCFFGLLALLLCWRFAKHYSKPRDAAYALLCISLGTPFVYSLLFHGVFAHLNSAFAVAAFVLYWHTTRRDVGLKRWAILGALGGLAALVRWQDAVFFLCPILELAGSIREGRTKDVLQKLATMTGLALVTFAPQMVVWHAVYGSPLAIPQGSSNLHWYAPKIGPLLFSPHHGLFVWSPIYLLVPLGLYFLCRRDRLLGAALSVCLALQVYTNSVHQWSGGWSFGVRRIVDCTVIGVVAVATLLSRITSPHARKIVIACVAACTLWTLLLVIQMKTEMIDPEAYVSLGTLARNQLEILLNSKHYLSLLPSSGETHGPLPVRGGLIFLVAILTFVAYQLSRRTGQARALEIVGVSALGLSVLFSALIGTAVTRTEVPQLQDADERARFETLRNIEAALSADARPEGLAKAAELCASLSWDQEAEGYLRRYVSLRPDDNEARFNLGIMLLKTQDFAEAYRTFSSLKSSGYRAAESTYYASVALMNEERFEEAFNLFLGADVEGELKRSRLFNAAECLRQLGRDDEARNLFLQILRAEPDNKHARLRLRMLGD